MIFMQ